MDKERQNELFQQIVHCEKSGNWDQVAEASLKMAELDLPDLEKVVAWVNAGTAYGHLAELEKALSCFERAIQMEARHHRFFALEHKAAFLATHGRTAESIAVYKNLLCRRDLRMADLERMTHNVKMLEEKRN